MTSTRAYEGFEGRIGRTMAGSESWWPPRDQAPAGAPNVIVMLVDDLGYSDLGAFGSEIDTPNLDAFAGRSLRYTNFHVTPMCSPTRASLMTGLNAHLAGIGHVAHSDPGFPGYAMELAPDALSLAEAFRSGGYATMMVGKWHLAKDSDISDAGPRHSWPLQRGFDRFYGFLDGFTNFFHPHRLISDNSPVEVDEYPDDYYLTDDLTDRAMSMIAAQKGSNPEQPFFCYFAHGAVHAPLQAKAADMAKYRGRYDDGWDELHDARFARQRQLGIVEEGTEPARRNTEPGNDVIPWADLSENERRLYARYMEVYAAMVDNIDQNFGRLMTFLEEIGEADNTIILFTSDNGASREGEVEGTTGYFVHLLGETDVAADLARIDEIGSARTTPHYPRGWAAACNTPFRLYKINTHAGGHTVPMLFSVPHRMDDPGVLRRNYLHVVDVFPTLMELCGIDPPTHRHGVEAMARQGRSFVETVEQSGSEHRRDEQIYEMIGHRGIYRDGWEAVTLHPPMTPFGDHEWELYDLRNDPTERNDLAAEHPDVVAELAARWETLAWENQIYPLDEGSAIKYLIRPERTAVFEQPVRLLRTTPTLERWRSLQLVVLRTFEVDVRLVHRTGDSGVLVAHGDQGGGYLVWVEDDTVRFAHNDGRGHMSEFEGPRLGTGPQELTLVMNAPGGGWWHPRLVVGDASAAGDPVRCLFPMAPFEGITVGKDPRSPVHWDLRQRHGVFAYSGELSSVTYRPGAPAPDAPVNLAGMLRDMGRKFE